jgi:class 3 adenylate cyclase/CHASE3 domain sensor protein
MSRPSVNRLFVRARSEVRQSAGVIIVAVIFLAVAAIAASFYISQRERQAQQSIAHTVGNERQLSALQSLLQDAEIGQRGYLLTNDRSYLEPYEVAIQAVAGALDALSEGVSDNSRQDGNVAVLRSMITQKLSELRQSIARQGEGDSGGALAIMQTGQGKMLMDGVRETLKTMRAEEGRKLAERVSEARSADRRMEMVVFFLALVTAVFAIVAIRTTSRRARSAELTRDELLSRLDRRLLAIMAADIAGYSKLMEGNETATLARLQVVRDLIDPIIESHAGTIVTTAGDSVLAAFSSALSAIDCALEIQREMANGHSASADTERLLFRIGINVGDVVVQNGDVFGDTVNVAARLEAIAEPGGICISRTVRDHVRKQRALIFDDLGFKQMKNIAQPVSAFRVREHPPQV